jgi:hypothetical protein
MSSHNVVQIYLNQAIKPTDLLITLSSLLNIQLETLDYPSPQAIGFVMLEEYKRGFPLGINVTWPKDISPNLDNIQIAKSISKHYNTQVATDLPSGFPPEYRQNPYIWCLVEPNGQLYQVEEKVGEGDVEGLVLNLESKHHLIALEQASC